MARITLRGIPFLTTCILLLGSQTSRAEELVGMPPDWMWINNLYTIDRSNGDLIGGVTVTSPGLVIHGCYGLATHPMTGEIWAILGDRDNDRLLGKIDPKTGHATIIGSLNTGSRRFAGLAFNADGTVLYGATGQNGSNARSLFTIDQTNAAVTLQCAMNTGDRGQSIAFNSSDSKLYHAIGQDTLLFETIDNTMTCAATNIPITGNTGSFYEFNSLTHHAGDNLFYTSSYDALHSLTASGTMEFINYIPMYIKGLATTDDAPLPGDCLPRGIAYFVSDDSFRNENILWKLTYDGSTFFVGFTGFEDISGLDFGPDNRLYGVGYRLNQNVQVLITIDPCTGAGTEIGTVNTGNSSVTDISFRGSDHALFALNNNHRLYRINPATGAAISVGNTTLTGHGDGIAFAPNGTLYHGDNTNLNTLSTNNGLATLVDSLDFPPNPNYSSRVLAMDYRPGFNMLYAVIDEVDNEQFGLIDTTDGTVVTSGQIPSETEAMAFTPPPGVCDPVSITFDYYDINSGDWDFEDSCLDCDSGPQMLPFQINIGGEIYTQFVQDSNGYVELYRDGETNYAFGFGAVADLTSDGDLDHSYLMAAYDRLDTSSFGQFGYYSENDRITFFWNTETNADQGANNLNEFQITLYVDGHVQWNFKTDEVADFDFDLFSGIYLGYDRQQLFQIAVGDIPEMTSWLFGDCLTGSCCSPNGSCVVTIEDNCVDTWTQGAVCNPNPCPQPQGSCCLNDGTCTETTQAACAGTWTLGGTCSPNPCPPVGSCCLPNGNCFVVKEAGCVGTWTEGGTCNPNPCPQPQEGATGACCLADDTCQVLTAAECDSLIGFYNGDGTTCDNTDCVMVNQQVCGALMCGPAPAALLPTVVGLLAIRWNTRRRNKRR